MVTAQVHSPVCVTETEISVLTEPSPVNTASYRIIKQIGYASVDNGKLMSSSYEKPKKIGNHAMCNIFIFGYYGENF